MAKYYEDVVLHIDSLLNLAEEAEEYGLDDFLTKFKRDSDFSESKRLSVLADLILYYKAPHLL